jgi:nucleoside 2-deoxyribosyltransferase
MNELYEKGIAPAIAAAGYKPKRIDENVAPVKICDDIILEIRRSCFIVADVTEQRQGVYFEAGFALGLGLSVIWTVRGDNVDKLNFDTRQYRHIVWSTPEGLRAELQARIEANIPRVHGKL